MWNPDLLKQYDISLMQVMDALRKTNLDIGAKPRNQSSRVSGKRFGFCKICKGYRKYGGSIQWFYPILIKDIAHVMIGPKQRRGILDKEGAEAVGGAVIARYGANPMQ